MEEGTSEGAAWRESKGGISMSGTTAPSRAVRGDGEDDTAGKAPNKPPTGGV